MTSKEALKLAIREYEKYLIDDEKWTKVRFNTFWWKDDVYTKREDMSMIQAFTKAGIKVELYYKEV